MNSFNPLLDNSKLGHWQAFKKHLYMAFRSFDIANYYETYVFVVVISLTALWALASFAHWLCTCRNAPSKKENQALALLKDDLVKSGPYKRDRSGIPERESIIKLHAVIFKHAQKKIIDKELDY